MTKTQGKPMFEINRGVTTMDVIDSDGKILRFNSELVGPMNYWQLRDSSYSPEGFNFRQPTFGELAPLVYGAVSNKCSPEANKVIENLRKYWMAGKTIALTGKDGFFVDDNPSLGMIKSDLGKYAAHLNGRLGRKTENAVNYSDDGQVRFVPYGFTFEGQSASGFANNAGLIALVGNPERAEMLAEASKNWRANPWLGTGFSKIHKFGLSVPGVGGDFNGRLVVFGTDPNYVSMFSFGVSEST